MRAAGIYRENVFLLAALLFLLLTPFTAYSDELRPAYLELTEVSPEIYNVYWKIPARGRLLRLSLDVLFDETVKRTGAPVAHFMRGSYVERWQVEATQGLANSTITIVGLERTSSEVLILINRLDGSAISHRTTPGSPSYSIEAEPGWQQVLATYLVLGVEHILLGFDHLLFVFALLLLIRRRMLLISTITAFTVAHSLTLALASLKLISIPVVPLEACIALSIVFVAVEIIQGQQGRKGLTARRPWVVAFSFGLLHGMGFAAALSEVGMPENALVLALVVFNIGVEAGQLIFVFFVLAVAQLLKRLIPVVPLWLIRIPPYIVGGVASFWVFQRVSGFS